ncbi:hypothetical protein SmJEL517_g03122 [Synchytrium microbalum]|uniref:Uncharacterized protein n=1 Tax=Synchytrium microbalum TaxID=1806994 RepID=A0A507C415_9FUNG|nr:uncharacterized protein SmJEL517_g03122 [Synchytrium microbalum]TPX34211.1 hypothetical protein SmJEL517_g03122 [Synchytrium microbalum]
MDYSFVQKLKLEATQLIEQERQLDEDHRRKLKAKRSSKHASAKPKQIPTSTSPPTEPPLSDLIRSTDGSVVSELLLLRSEYLRSGGNDPRILTKMNALEVDAIQIEQQLRTGFQTQPVLGPKRVVYPHTMNRHYIDTGYNNGVNRQDVFDRPNNVNNGGGNTNTNNANIQQPDPIEGEDEEMRALRIEHKKYLLKMQFEKERMLQEAEFEKLKLDTEGRTRVRSMYQIEQESSTPTYNQASIDQLNLIQQQQQQQLQQQQQQQALQLQQQQQQQKQRPPDVIRQPAAASKPNDRIATIEGGTELNADPTPANPPTAPATTVTPTPNPASEEFVTSIGVQFEEIRKFPGTQVRVRLCILDDSDPTHLVDASSTFVTELADLGVEDKSFGWSGLVMNHVFKDLVASPNKRGLIEVFEGALVAARTDVQLFSGSRRKGLSINEGFHRLKLYRAAELSHHAKDFAGANIALRIYKPEQGPPPTKTFEAKTMIPAMPRGAWLPVENKLDSTNTANFFSSGDGFDLYIDGARYLPANATVSRVTARIFNSTFEVLNYGSTVPGTGKRDRDNTGDGIISSKVDLDSLVHSPSYNTRCEYRFPTSQLPDKTGVVLFKLYTLCKVTKQLRMVGTSVLNLFVGNPDHLILNEGAHQISVSRGTPDVHAFLSGTSLDGFPRSPCTTLLVRLVHIKPGDLATPAPAPKYSDSIYDSSPSKPTPYELKLYPFVATERPSVTVRDALLEMKDLIRVQSDDALLHFVSKFLTKPDKVGKVPALDVSYVCKYDASFGFKISCDAAQNLRCSKGFAVAIISLNPPGFFYLDGGLASVEKFDDITYTKKTDLDSSLRSPMWKDGFQVGHSYRRRPYDPKLVAIIDIRCMVSDGSDYRLEAQGWTIVQIFKPTTNTTTSSNEKYVRLANEQLPLYEGEPPESLILDLQRRPNDKTVEDVLAEHVATRSITYTKGSSVFVRVCDGRRDEEMDLYGRDVVDTTSLPQRKIKSFVEEVYTRKVESLVPKGVDVDEWRLRVMSQFAEITGLPMML